ncbi:alginate O-acetyltransferase complex protein AlgI [Ekhidna lutea]|uniref:Alginate O-acetyltransferase complex protein AlgI n=1 Tax=Ekhidna lutea TaxID=447679 RepID=A0A239GXZ4_EKHLU|nr:MBOAT family O-acyltransferase [Ekhidna lutea]SNS72914.1 alginate O-acetyltransferase complex protein AlgI [Ekhidna lutea]
MQVLLIYVLIGAITVGIYWAVKEELQPFVVIAGSVVFFSLHDVFSLLILATTSIITFYLLRRGSGRNFYFSLSFILLSFLFIIFKVGVTIEEGSFSASLPLGMSFYLFRLLHYAIESFKGNLRNTDLKSFMTFMFFLPVMIIGPIIRLGDWSKEMKRRRWNPELFSNGMERILFGFLKITFLGNFLVNAKLSTFIRSFEDEQSWIVNYLECFQYTANSYLQFAGYSDIAVGLSMLFGIRIMENFRFPFLATDINDFWKRWHISLSNWCRDYIFMPVASFSRLTWLAIIASMLVLGLWHELSVRYILWGSFHGVGIVIWNLQDKYFGRKLSDGAMKIYSIFGRIITLHFVIFSFAFVKEESVSESFRILLILVGLD